MKDRPLPRAFYERHTLSVARELLGQVLVRKTDEGTMTGRIVETEAYRGQDDPASHAYRGATPRNRVMFGHGGFAYVYYVYGFHYCLNATTELPGKAGAVLIRAVEPLEGLEQMLRNRSLAPTSRLEDIASGPGKLTRAMNITSESNGGDLTGKGALYICESTPSEPFRSGASGRIGVKSAYRRPWRFFVVGNRFVSQARPLIAPKNQFYG